MIVLCLYVVALIATTFFIASMAVSIKLNKDVPIMATPSEIKNEITYRQLIVACAIGCIPFLNILGTVLLVMFSGINIVIWLLSSPKLNRKPFAKKQWTTLHD